MNIRRREAWLAALLVSGISTSLTLGCGGTGKASPASDASSPGPDATPGPDASANADSSIPMACVPDGDIISPHLPQVPDAAMLIGAPCVSNEEADPLFSGFSVNEIETVSTEDVEFVCLIYHFQGRVSCPYGQNSLGVAPANSTCTTIETCSPITPSDPTNGEAVMAQCTNRTAEDAVYISCRCANPDGGTDDGSTYCTCPSTMACVQTVSSLGPGSPDSDLAGAYCIKNGTEWGADAGCSSLCSPLTAPCP